ncbi:DUF1292 domain-containing protein [Anaeromicropila herbilytica]|uniref:DUF1292 domain-containing protein n=1 Tax=Anaeromicropila herbilytica TaxID=2785025 RepID=A0A7R7IBJ8_9FIRM|nr:DUF1292 domain-containing protein [Anaeromicropila herbilytica]BCN29718.1 hypothetical protein bsdtb5_10130 [Anaeromicropila herbilytica]
MSEHKYDKCECGDNCDCGHDRVHEGEHTTVTLTLDDGSEVECAVLTILTVGDNQYIALLPMDSEEEESEVYLYRYNELEDDEIELLNIEEDEEYEAVSEAFDEYLDSEEFEDMLDEDEDEE